VTAPLPPPLGGRPAPDPELAADLKFIRRFAAGARQSVDTAKEADHPEIRGSLEMLEENAARWERLAARLERGSPAPQEPSQAAIKAVQQYGLTIDVLIGGKTAEGMLRAAYAIDGLPATKEAS
jgi:hypothetical protein